MISGFAPRYTTNAPKQASAVHLPQQLFAENQFRPAAVQSKPAGAESSANDPRAMVIRRPRQQFPEERQQENASGRNRCRVG